MIRLALRLLARLLILLGLRALLTRALDRALPTKDAKPPARSRCGAVDEDGKCNWPPEAHCPRGLCIAHCVCWCREKHYLHGSAQPKAQTEAAS